MADGCSLKLEGIEQVMKNLQEFPRKLKATLALDAQNIATEMEAWAKNNANWEDQTSHARQFLKSTVKWKNTNTLMVALSQHVEYGVYLELANEGKYAILEKAIAEFAPKFQESWKKIIESSGVI